MPAEYKNYIVTFLDILGFRNLLKTRRADEINDIISETRKHTADENGEEAELGLETVAFSDSVIRMFPADDPGGLFFELLGLVHAQAGLISKGVLIRGGLTIGDVFHDGDRAFGPGFVEAYDLESAVAVYPRLVVSPQVLVDFAANKYPTQNPLEEEMKAIMALLDVGDDGIHFVDYLRAIRSELDDPADYPRFLADHQKLIVKLGSALGVASVPSSLHMKVNWIALYHNRVVGQARAKGYVSDDDNLVISSNNTFRPTRCRRARLNYR